MRVSFVAFGSCACPVVLFAGHCRHCRRPAAARRPLAPRVVGAMRFPVDLEEDSSSEYSASPSEQEEPETQQPAVGGAYAIPVAFQYHSSTISVAFQYTVPFQCHSSGIPVPFQSPQFLTSVAVRAALELRRLT